MSTTPPAVVEAGDFTYDSSRATAAEMIRALKPADPKDPAPREVKRGARGETETTKQPDPVSDAASTLGKKGAEAAAKARKQEAKAKPAADKPDVAEAREGDDKAKAAKAKEPADLDTDEGDEDNYETPELKARAAEAVKRATREAAEAKREAKREREARERIERERDEERRARPAVREEQPAARREPAPVDDPEPQESDIDAGKYPDYPSFVKAAARWAAREEQREIQRAQAQEQGHREVVKTISTHVETFHERVTGLKGDDKAAQGQAFNDFMAELPDALVSKLTPSFMIPRGEDGRPVVKPGPANLITDLIVKSSVPGAMLRHFADDMNAFDRVEALGDPDAIKHAIWKIEARLEDATAGNPSSDERPGSNPEISKARPPARPVAVSPRNASAEPGSDSSLDDHIEFYNARDREKRKRRA